MNSAQLPYGLDLDTEKLVHITEARNGLECGLVCPSDVCRGDLVAKNNGKMKIEHFAHHVTTTACEGWLHDTGKRLLWDRIQKALHAGESVEVAWDCKECCCREVRNLLRSAARVELEPTLEGEATIRPDVVTFNDVGAATAIVEIVVTHAPERPVHHYAERAGVGLVICLLSEESDLEWLGKGILKAEVHYAPCKCEKGKCKHCVAKFCDANQSSPLPHSRCEMGFHCYTEGTGHFYCGKCEGCVWDDDEPHFHCECGRLIKGTYPRCYCCHLGCEEQRDHRHCKKCQKPVINKNIWGMFWEECYQCHSKGREVANESGTDGKGRETDFQRCCSCRFGCHYVCFLS